MLLVPCDPTALITYQVQTFVPVSYTRICNSNSSVGLYMLCYAIPVSSNGTTCILVLIVIVDINGIPGRKYAVACQRQPMV